MRTECRKNIGHNYTGSDCKTDCAAETIRLPRQKCLHNQQTHRIYMSSRSIRKAGCVYTTPFQDRHRRKCRCRRGTQTLVFPLLRYFATLNKVIYRTLLCCGEINTQNGAIVGPLLLFVE